MPFGDGTGPLGTGWPRLELGGGWGLRSARASASRGRMGGNRPGSGPGGSCVCPKCGARVPHTRAVPCFSVNCQVCGTRMIKE